MPLCGHCGFCFSINYFRKNKNTTRGGRKAHRPTPKTRTIHPTYYNVNEARQVHLSKSFPTCHDSSFARPVLVCQSGKKKPYSIMDVCRNPLEVISGSLLHAQLLFGFDLVRSLDAPGPIGRVTGRKSLVLTRAEPSRNSSLSASA
jgi:hypothetical protein